MAAKDIYAPQLRAAAQAVSVADEALLEARRQRDNIILRAVAAGMSERGIAANALVSRGWVYQLRHRCEP